MFDSLVAKIKICLSNKRAKELVGREEHITIHTLMVEKELHNNIKQLHQASQPVEREGQIFLSKNQVLFLFYSGLVSFS